MTNTKKIILSIIALISLSVIITVFIILNINNFEPLPVDVAVRDFAYNIRGEKYGFMFWLFRILTELGYVYVIVAIILIVGIITKGNLPTLILGCAEASAYVGHTIVKLIANRERPIEAMRWMNETSSSFPSGHSTNSMCLYVLLAYLFVRETKFKKSVKITVSICCGIAVLIVGFSRIILGVHYFTDVLSGYAYGIFWATLWIFIYEVLRKKNFTFLNKYFNKNKNVDSE